MIFSFSLFAEGELSSSQSIYEALDVEAIQVNPGINGVYRLEKGVGGLYCAKSKVVSPNAEDEYFCDLLVEEMDAEAIYNALLVEEVADEPMRFGAMRFFKSVGELVCLKSKIVYPGSKFEYSCTL